MLSLFFSGCATVPPPSEVIQEEAATTPAQPTVVADRPFEMDTLYSLLVAEIAGERQRFDVMLSNYVQQAEATSDPGVTARATRLARYLNAHGPALEMAQLWLEIAPENPEAHYIAVAELVHSNRLLEALPHAMFLQYRGETSGFDAIGARAQQGGDIETTRQLIKQYQPLLKQNPDDVALNIGASLLYQHAGDLEKALIYAQNAMRIAPDDFQSSAQEARVLQQMGRSEQALDSLKRLVASNPDNAHLRLQYARALLKTDLSLAQEQFATLLSDAPDDLDLLMTLALVEYERGLLNEARARFAQLAQSNSSKHRSSAHYYLGRIAQVQKDDQAAIDHFSQVQPGSDHLPALAQLTELLVNRGEGKQALGLIIDQRQNASADQVELIEGLYLLEAHLLTSAGLLPQALDTLTRAIEEFPESTRLFYSRAMLFISLDNLAQAEQDFKSVLAITPENAAALNAWGYTLADRTDRLDEAYQYISKAYQLAPDDPAVIDSMGWIEHLRGNHSEALVKLKRAMKTMPDHEIAAHLGEVLWVTGQQQEAHKIWSEGLKLKPQSDIILDTMKRLNAKLPNLDTP